MPILLDHLLVRLAWFALNFARFVYRRFAYELEVKLARRDER